MKNSMGAAESTASEAVRAENAVQGVWYGSPERIQPSSAPIHRQDRAVERRRHALATGAHDGVGSQSISKVRLRCTRQQPLPCALRYPRMQRQNCESDGPFV